MNHFLKIRSIAICLLIGILSTASLQAEDSDPPVSPYLLYALELLIRNGELQGGAPKSMTAILNAFDLAAVLQTAEAAAASGSSSVAGASVFGVREPGQFTNRTFRYAPLPYLTFEMLFEYPTETNRAFVSTPSQSVEIHDTRTNHYRFLIGPYNSTTQQADDMIYTIAFIAGITRVESEFNRLSAGVSSFTGAGNLQYSTMDFGLTLGLTSFFSEYMGFYAGYSFLYSGGKVDYSLLEAGYDSITPSNATSPNSPGVRDSTILRGGKTELESYLNLLQETYELGLAVRLRQGTFIKFGFFRQPIAGRVGAPEGYRLRGNQFLLFGDGLTRASVLLQGGNNSLSLLLATVVEKENIISTTNSGTQISITTLF